MAGAASRPQRLVVLSARCIVLYLLKQTVAPSCSHLMSPPASSDHVRTHLGGSTGAQVDISSSSPWGGC